jgi:hypothetical protein
MKDVPLFIARFANGHEASVAVFCSLDALDPARGAMLVRRAYAKLYCDAHGEHREAPAIVCARFELNNGEVLATYDATTLAELVVPVDDNPYAGIVPLAGTSTVERARPDVPADDSFSRWLKDNPPPDLQGLVRKYGGYSNIPAAAWAEYDRAVEAWQRCRRDRYERKITHAPDLRRASAHRRAPTTMRRANYTDRLLEPTSLSKPT